MDLQMQGSFSPIKGKLNQLRGQGKAAQSWAVTAANSFKASLAYYYDHPNPPRSSATNHLRQELGQDHDRLIDHVQVTVDVTASGIVVTIGMEPGDAEMIALVQEYGAVIEMTDRMRDFLHAHGIHPRATTKAIRVPARYPWQRAWEASRPRAMQALGTLI